jgi:hypothetical protein
VTSQQTATASERSQAEGDAVEQADNADDAEGDTAGA